MTESYSKDESPSKATRRSILAPDFDRIPEELQTYRQWALTCVTLTPDGRLNKPPLRPSGALASSTDPATWSSFADVRAAHAASELASRETGKRKFHAPGYMLSESDPFTAIDIDCCCDPDTRIVEPWAQKIIESLASYSEFSISKTGIRIVLKGKLPGRGRKKKGFDGNSDGGLEVYDKARFVVITGVRIKGTPATIEERQAALDTLMAEYFPTPQKPVRARVITPLNLSDQEIVDVASRVKNGARFLTLYRDGDLSGYGNDHSRGDFALLATLFFYTHDLDQAARIFSSSALGQRGKWADRQDYRERTLEGVAQRVSNFYEPRRLTLVKGAMANGAGVGAQLSQAQSKGDSLEYSYPELSDDALVGPAGDFVRLVGPETESDRAALLIQFLVATGCAIGRGPHHFVESAHHYPALYAAIVGRTAAARKGTSWAHVRSASLSTSILSRSNIATGLASGEGLINHVRDPRTEMRRNQKTDELEEVEVESGIADKRLLVVCPEFSQVLKVCAREGNTLSEVIRQAWDVGDLHILSRNAPVRATGAHVAIVAHITSLELEALLTETDIYNGFSNRFLWVCAERSKVLPFGGKVESPAWRSFLHDLPGVIARAQQIGRIEWSGTAVEIWKNVYPVLSAPKLGALGAVISRAEAQVCRLSTLYAALRGSPVLDQQDLTAALAAWTYCEDSARFIFGGRLGNAAGDKILDALREKPDGLTRSEVFKLFGNRISADLLSKILEMLKTEGLVEQLPQPSTGGRPGEIWKATLLRKRT